MPRTTAVLRLVAVPLIALIAACLASLAIGSAPSSPADLWQALVAPRGTDLDVTIRSLRVPRTVTGVIAGAALAVAGVLVQGHTRNPVADPGLLGITQGAAVAVVVLATLGVDPFSTTTAVAAFAGALAASAIVVMIASGGRAMTPVALVLAGAAVSAMLGALVTATVLFNDQALDALRFWQVGSLAALDRPVQLAGVTALVGIALAFANARGLDAIALGDENARSLGVRLGLTRTVGVVAVALLAAAAVMIAGPLAFAGLLAPHLARALAGASTSRAIAVAIPLGAALVLAADVIGRVIARPGELPVGVMLAVIGAPCFIALAQRRRLVMT